MTGKEDPVVLSYFDCIIRNSDIDILKNDEWLNDAIIGFYFLFLEKVRYPLNHELLFIGPEVTQCLKESPADELSVFLDPLLANDKDYIFMAVNDSENDGSKYSGGTHWSLLVFCRPSNTFYHFDSLSATNAMQALKLAQNVGQYLTPYSKVRCCEHPSLQQNNSYDCGIYLLGNVQNIAEHVINHRDQMNELPPLRQDCVSNMRYELLEIIISCKSLP